jgi:hypothetical protein
MCREESSCVKCDGLKLVAQTKSPKVAEQIVKVIKECDPEALVIVREEENGYSVWWDVTLEDED